MTLIEELKLRGMVQDIMPGTEELLEKESVSAYIGVDPTADSLHVGNLATLMLLVYLKRDGHQPVALVGGATGMVGDPSGRSEERTLLDEATLQQNIEGVHRQLQAILDIPSTGKADLPVKMVNNYDWFKDMGTLEFLRKIGKHLTINYMLAKDSVKSRIDSGLSFTEFSYQLIQGYDFCHLYQHEGVKLQMGGSDQWGNITAGTELIRRIAGGEAFAFTCPLITKADGSKFGKSEGGNIWLDAKKTSPYRFYQFWLNTSDDDAAGFIKRFTLMDLDDIELLIARHKEAPHLRELQKALAKEITVLVHGIDAFDQAVVATEIMFKGTKEQLQTLDAAQLLEILEGVPQFSVPSALLSEGVDVIDLLGKHTQILPSKSEATRSVKQNSISINMEKVTLEHQVSDRDLLNERFILVQKGKKNRYLVTVE